MFVPMTLIFGKNNTYLYHLWMSLISPVFLVPKPVLSLQEIFK